MNIRRGLWRLWIVGSLLWAAVTGSVLVADIAKNLDKVQKSAFINCGKIEEERSAGNLSMEERRAGKVSVEELELAKCHLEKKLAAMEAEEAWENLADAGGVIVVLPLSVLALGFAGLWIARGFNRNQ